MADPVTMGIVLAATSAAGAYQQGQAAKKAAEYNAGVTRYEQSLALQDQSVQGQMATGRAIAGYGASGVSGDTGSPLDVLAFSAAEQARDRLKIRYNYSSRANLADAEAKNYGTSSVLNAFSAGARGYATGISMFGSTPKKTGKMLPQEDFGGI